nr:hypothetical protein [Tanacetum cinerariifolium]
MFNKEEPKPVKKNSFSPPIIEDWVSESKEEYDPKFQKQVQPSFPKTEFVKAKDQNQSFRKPVKQVERAKSNTHRPRGNQRNWNNLMNQRLGSLQSAEEILMHYKKIEPVFTEKINVLNLKVKLMDKVLAEYTKNLEEAEKERDELKLKLEKLQNSSKSLNTLLDSQVSDKSKAGLRYKELIPDSFVNSSETLEKQDNRSDKGYH